MNIGIDSKQRTEVAEALAKFLATTYTLYLKTQNFHWNVTGVHFHSLHVMFEEQYGDLAEAVDEIAERIRSLGERAPGSFSEFAQLTEIEEATTAPLAEDMVKQLLHDHETVIASARNVITIAEAAGDGSTVGLVSERLSVHEKTAWMLRSSQ